MKKLLFPVPVLMLLAGCGLSLFPQEGFVKTPYLQNPQTNEITIRWSSDSWDVCTVKYGVGTELKAERTIASCEPVGSKEPEFLFRARLVGLRPGTRYRYAVACGADRHEGTFRTFPKEPEPFTFIAYGDSRTRSDVHKAVASGFPKHNPAFILHTGDMTGSGAFRQWQREFFDPLADVIGNIPLWPARGNHDGGAAFRRLFTLPAGRLYYSFDYANAHFVCLDFRGGANRDEMLAWLETDLAASRATWKFVFYHFPSYDVGKHHGHWGRETVLPILRRYGVDFVFAGHSHSYQRFHPMFTRGENERNPITHIVTAGGGAPLYRVEFDPHVAVAVSANHYVVVGIDGNSITFRVLGPDGSVLDAFQVTKSNGRLDADYLRSALPEDTFGRLAQAIVPFLRGLTLSERLDPARPATLTFKLGAGPHPMSFKISLEERARKHYEMTPVTGTVGADEVADLTVSIRPKEEITIGKGGAVLPVLRLLCVYDINGDKGKLYSSRLKCPEPPQQ